MPLRGAVTTRASLGLYLAAVFLLLLARVVRVQIADPDLWGRISVGAVLFQAGHLPVVDDFSFFASKAQWIDHEWLSGVVFYAALAGAGEAGLVLLKYALLATCLALVLLLQRRSYGAAPWVAGIALALVAPTLVVGFSATVRAQAFSFPIFMLWLLILEGVRCGRDSPRSLAWLIPLTVLWGNLHGGIAMGFLATGVYGVSEALLGRPRRFVAHLMAGLAMLGALAIANPYGPAYMGFLVEAWTLDRSGITEWAPLLAGGLQAKNLPGAILVVVSVAVACLGCWADARSRSKPAHEREATPLAPALLLLLWSVMTLMAQRIQPFLGLTLAAVLPAVTAPIRRGPAWDRLRSFLEDRPASRRGLDWLVPALLCGLGLVGLAGSVAHRPLLATVVPDEHAPGATRRFVYPVGAMRFLLASPYEGRLLNPFSQGEFLYWSLYPRFRVGSDGRYEEVYSGEEFWKVYDFYHQHAPGSPQIVRRFASESGADFVLFRSSWRNFRVLADSPSWREIYDDGVFGIVARRDVLAKHARYEAPRTVARRRRATIGDFFDAPESGRGRFADYP